MVDIAYLIFFVLAVGCFRFFAPRNAVLGIVLTGWLLLPVAHYPYVSPMMAAFPYWITGLAMPADMLLSKAWVVPVAALAGALLFDFRSCRTFRPHLIDMPMAGWCLWPLAVGIAVPSPEPAPFLAAAYLTGSWGTSWLLGRVYFSGQEGQASLLKGLALGALGCAPIALLEGMAGPFLYDSIYGPHPFRLDGAVRYAGYRPLGFFENGNQYGIWVAMCALAALWVYAAHRRSNTRLARAGIALLAVLIAIASQSVGAVVLLVIGMLFLTVARLALKPWVIAAVLIGFASLSAVYVSGAVPLRAIAEQTAVGQKALGAFRAMGRGSFTWRMGQDVRTLPTVRAAPLMGTGQWDWWRVYGTRPWGLAMLIMGQFGLIGFALAFGALALPALKALLVRPVASGWSRDGAPLALAVIVILTLCDALLNAFLFFPAIVAAGALVGGKRFDESVRSTRR